MLIIDQKFFLNNEKRQWQAKMAKDFEQVTINRSIVVARKNEYLDMR